MFSLDSQSHLIQQAFACTSISYVKPASQPATNTHTHTLKLLHYVNCISFHFMIAAPYSKFQSNFHFMAVFLSVCCPLSHLLLLALWCLDVQRGLHSFVSFPLHFCTQALQIIFSPRFLLPKWKINLILLYTRSIIVWIILCRLLRCGAIVYFHLFGSYFVVVCLLL